MKASLRQRLDAFAERFEELAALLAEPDVIGDQRRFRDYSREYAELEQLVEAWRVYRGVEGDIEAAEQLASDSDPEMREDRKSTRLNSSHVRISYAVFCLK